MSDIEYIRERLPEEVLFTQLAEEATELAQAALKMYRIIDGRNPTPVRLSEAWANIQEEVSDVLLCLQMLGISAEEQDHQETIRQKLDRWAGRLSEVCALFLETKDKRYWWHMIQLLPSSYNQKRTVLLNYEVLANYYHIAFTDDKEADLVQEELDRHLKEVYGDDFQDFFTRYPYVKKMNYMKPRKGWVD